MSALATTDKPVRIAAEISQADVPSPPALRVVGEVGPVFEGKEYARIEPGEYAAQCAHAKVYRDPGFRTWKALLRFRLIDGGQEIYGFYNMGRGESPHAGRRSRYWAAWTLANGAPPRRGQTMTPRVFRGKVFLVQVSDVTHTGDGKPHHPSAIYSTVKKIIEKMAG
jgi:hypothetical protein